MRDIKYALLNHIISELHELCTLEYVYNQEPINIMLEAAFLLRNTHAKEKAPLAK